MQTESLLRLTQPSVELHRNQEKPLQAAGSFEPKSQFEQIFYEFIVVVY